MFAGEWLLLSSQSLRFLEGASGSWYQASQSWVLPCTDVGHLRPEQEFGTVRTSLINWLLIGFLWETRAEQGWGSGERGWEDQKWAGKRKPLHHLHGSFLVGNPTQEPAAMFLNHWFPALDGHWNLLEPLQNADTWVSPPLLDSD